MLRCSAVTEQEPPKSERLSRLLLAHRDELIHRWCQVVSDSSQTLRSLPHVSLVDAMGVFIEQIAAALAGQPGVQREVARHHGEHRSKTASRAEDLHLEYAALVRLTCVLAEETGEPVSPEELLELSEAVIFGAVEAAHAHATYHQRLSRRHDAEHFAFVAHDLRNPLASIRYAWELLAMQGQLPASEPVRVIERALKRLVERLDVSVRLLQARIGPKGTDEPWKTVNIDDLVRDACEELELDARRYGVTFDLTGVTSISVLVHPHLLLAAVVNLLHNAVKHSPRGGRVRISTEKDVDALVITISDDGPGISPGSLDEIYKVFQTGRTDTAGFGLGLAIVQQAADAHGGSVHVEVPQRGGCRFKLAIPLVSNAIPN